MSTPSGIIKDPVTETQYAQLNYNVTCEHCTHFDAYSETCTFGYRTGPHRLAQHQLDLKTIGKVAFCRTMEID